MGNLFAESGLKSDNLQNTGNAHLNMTDEEYTRAVDNGTYSNFINDKIGYGLAQWTYWSRKQPLLEFAKQQNKSISDADMQLKFLIQELKKDFSKVWQTLLNAKSVREASDAVLVDFEQPGNQTEKNKQRRCSYGQLYYDKFVRTTEEKYIEYEIVYGDTLSAIAEQHNTTTDILMELNKIVNPDLIYVGDCLKIPVQKQEDETYLQYKVVRGDTLTKIARKYDTTVSALAKINNLKNPDCIRINQIILIPNKV